MVNQRLYQLYSTFSLQYVQSSSNCSDGWVADCVAARRVIDGGRSKRGYL